MIHFSSQRFPSSGGSCAGLGGRLLDWAAKFVATSSLLLAAATPTQAKVADLRVDVGNPEVLANQTNTTYLKIALSGRNVGPDRGRAPVNVALVLDRSGSMQGAKIAHLREAAKMAVDRLSTGDSVSVVAYDSGVEVLVKATRLNHSRSYSAVKDAISQLHAGGSTALFAGVSRGAAELRRFLSRNRVNRMILISDGLANVGPATPHELGELGASLGREGMAVTTIGLGLGYNEDLMTELAGFSDGNHAFVEHPAELASIFDREFGDVLSVVGQRVEIVVECADGIRPIRVLGRDAEVVGSTVRTRMNQIYRNQEKYLLLEVEVPPGTAGKRRDLASVNVRYLDVLDNQDALLRSTASIAYTKAPEAVKAKRNQKVLSSAISQIANERSREAVKLRDAGKAEEAKMVLEEAAEFLDENAADLPAAAPQLEAMQMEYEAQADAIERREDWARQRKALKKSQYSREKQQSY